MPIRKANAGDAVSIWEIRNAAILSGCQAYYPVELLKAWTGGEMTEQFVQAVIEQFYVATLRDEVLGTGAINLDSAQLDAVFVRPDMMGRGVGRQIVAFLEELARQAGLTRLTLDSTLNAASFYRRCGFVGEAVSTYHSPRGIALECIPMEKELVLPRT
jgi:N-acetylglutamate synthase-like GNAT family acetyltransferase